TDVRGNRARHAGAVRIRWRIGAATGVVALDDPAGEVRLFRIDLRIDQRDDDVFALSDAVYGAELQFLHDVLRGIAVPTGGAAQLLRQAVGVIGLCRDVKSRAFDLPDHLGDRPSVGDAECVDGTVECFDRLLRYDDQIEAARDVGNLLRRHFRS